MSKLTVVDHYPSRDASGVYVNDVVWAQFSEQINSETATYYNFVVTERSNYEPVDGTINVQGVSGNLNDAVIVFVPNDYLKRNTGYSVLVSTGITNKNNNENLDTDYTWYFETGNIAQSGNIGDDVYDLDPSGVTTTSTTVSGYISGASPLKVLETYPSDYDTNVKRNLGYISIRFNAPIPSGVDLYDKIVITPKRVLG